MKPQNKSRLMAILSECEKASCFTESERLAFTSARSFISKMTL